MNDYKPHTAPRRTALFILVGTLTVGLGWPLAGPAQDKAPDTGKPEQPAKSTDAGKDLAAQLAELRAKVARLEAAVAKGQPAKAPGMAGMGGKKGKGMEGMEGMEEGDMDEKKGKGMKGMEKGGMGGKMKGMDMEAMESEEKMGQMMQKMGEMMQMMGQMKSKGMSGMGDKGMGKMGGMSDKGMSKMADKGKSKMGGMGMGMMDMDMQEMMGMMGMGGMGQKGAGMGKMQMATALPGFPGASHIYHIGASGFFLDHPDHIKLTPKQQTTLNGLKEKALLDKSTSQRKIDEAEQELWTLTASDKPDAVKIDAKVRDIEKLRGDQRMAFIASVGGAAKVLTDEQRQALLGNAGDKSDKPDPHAGHKPPAK